MDAVSANLRSDVQAKQAFCDRLRLQGYHDVRITGSPVDVVAKKDGAMWQFELKYTAAKKVCFGAATLTEWVAAAKDPLHFRFVIAYQIDGSWTFELFTPDEFMAFSSVPPYKIYFSIPLGGRRRKTLKASRRILLTKARLQLLGRQFEELRSIES